MPDPENTGRVPQRRRGRPRQKEIDAAVGPVVWELLDEMGYDGLTFDAVADRAGCSRPALYRRWSNKRALVLDVLNRFIEATAAARPVNRGEGADAIFGWLRGLVDFLSGTGRGALLALSHARRRDPELADALDRIMVEDRPKFIDELRSMLGSEPSDARLHRIVDALIGTVFFRVSLQDRGIEDDELRMIVEEQTGVAPAKSSK